MQVPIFLAADFANKGDRGKVNVLGIFNVIYASNFPAKHKSLYIVMRVGLEYGEFDVDHDIKVLFIDEDGKELGKQEGKLSVPRPEKGGELYADLILPIDNLILEKPGRYEFRLIINRESKRTIPIDVIQINSDTTRD